MWDRRRSGLHVRSRDNYKFDYLGTYSAPGSATTFVLPMVLLGKPDPTREIFLVVYARNGTITSRTLSSVSLLGTAGVTQSASSGSGRSVSCVRIPSPHPSSSAPLSLTFSGDVADYISAGVFRAANRAAHGLDASDVSGVSDFTLGGTSATVNATTIKPKGFLIGIGAHDGTGPSTVTGADLKANVISTDNSAIVATALADVSVTPSVVWSWSGTDGYIARTWSFDFAT